MDRTEEWRDCAQALRLSPLRGSRGGQGDHAPVRGIQAVRELFSAVVQAGRQTARRCQGDQALSSAANALRATATVRQYCDGHQEHAAGDLSETRSVEASRGNTSGTGLSGG